ELRAGGQVGVRGGGDRVEVLLDGRRLVLEGVADAEAAADVVDVERAEHGDRLDRPGERLGVQDLRPDVQVQPVLGVVAAGGLRLVGDRGDAGDDPDQYFLGLGGQLLEAVDVVEVVDHDGAHAGVQGHGQLGGG